MQKIFFGGLLLVLTLIACRKEKCHDVTNPACESYNPCISVHPLSADFSIYENDCTRGPGQYDTSWHYYPTDTILTDCAIFTVNDTTVDSVRWVVGARSYTSRSFYLSFTGQRSQPISITLTVYKHNRNNCYPTDDTVKTLTKILYFTDSCYALGAYHGYFDNNPADTGTIAIVMVDTGFNTAAYHIRGFKPGCDDAYGGNLGTGGSLEFFYTSMYISGGASLGTCNETTGSLYYNRSTGAVLVNYTTYHTISTPRIRHNFNGYKIN